MLKQFALLSMTIALAGCSGAEGVITPMSPTSPTAVTVPPFEANFTTVVARIRGYVSDTANRRLAGARVEVLDGLAAGTSAIVNSEGIVDLVGTFDPTTRFRATMDGHETLTQTWTCSVPQCRNNAQPWLGFQLRPLAPPIDLTGTYTLTITADASCTTLPPQVRARSYPATVTTRFREGSADVLGFNVHLDSEAVLEPWRHQVIGVAVDFVRWVIASGHGDEPALIENLGNDAQVAFTGYSEAILNRPSAGNIELNFNGSIGYSSRREPSAASSCTATTHRLTLTRR